jgi:hypothetical protein
MADRGYRTIKVILQHTEASVYTSPKVATALEDILANATMYEGVKIGQILEAVYKQGKKDGARDAFNELDRTIAAAKKQVPHKNPGRPRKRSHQG